MSTGWTATVAHATSNVQAYATSADRAGVAFGPGELVYLIDDKCFQYWDGTGWQEVATAGAAAPACTVETTLQVNDGSIWSDYVLQTRLPEQGGPTAIVTATTIPVILAAGGYFHCWVALTGIPPASGAVTLTWSTFIAVSNQAGTQQFGGTPSAQITVTGTTTNIAWSKTTWQQTGSDLNLAGGNQQIKSTAGGIITATLQTYLTWA